MVHQREKIRSSRLRAVSSLETGPAQPDPGLREGRAGGLYKAFTAVAIAFILAVVFYGLNAAPPQGTVTAQAPSAGSPAPTGANPAASSTTGQGGAQTTGQGAPMRDGTGAGANTAESSGGQEQQQPQATGADDNSQAPASQGQATQAPANPR